MGWFRRNKDEPADEPVRSFQLDRLPATQSVSEPESTMRGVVFLDNGDIHLNVGTVEEAKLAIKQLKLKKKEYAVAKKAVTNEMSQIRATRSQQVAQQGSMMRGGGNVGKTVRTFERIGRDADKRKHANTLAPLEAQKAAIARATLVLDQAIMRIEAFLLENQQ
jgi:hypothetical protein